MKTLTLTTPSDREIVMTRVFDAPRTLVWEAFTKPELLKRWLFGPPGWTLAVCESEGKVGGTYRYVWRGPAGEEMGMGGVIREMVAPERMVATEKFDQPWYPGEAVGTIVLTERDGKTTLTQTIRYESREARDAALRTPMEQGVTMSYDRLAGVLASIRTPEPAQGREDLVVSRVFDAPVARVWQAWTDPEQVMRWWGPNGFTSPMARLDVREGGVSLVCMRSPQWMGGQDLYSTWAYRKIVPMERIEYIHNLADEKGNKIDPAKLSLPPDFPQDMRHVVTFESTGGKTVVTVTEYDWPVGHMRNMSRMGMEQCLEKMAGIFA